MPFELHLHQLTGQQLDDDPFRLMARQG
jgi:hypothetical protein